MRKGKKVCAFGVSAVMAVTSFAGCSSSGRDAKESEPSKESEVKTTGEETTKSTEEAATTTAVDTRAETEDTTSPAATDEPVTVNLFSQVSSYSGLQKGWAAKVLLEKFNVKLNIIPDLDGDTLSREPESGTYDIIQIFDGIEGNYKSAVEKGLFLDWNKDGLLDNYGSYIKENLSKELELNKEENGGTCYGFRGPLTLAGSQIDEGLFNTWDIRWDLYEQLGRPEVKDLDDYYDLLLDMKELCSEDEYGRETYAFSMWSDWDTGYSAFARYLASAYYGCDEWGIGLYDTDTGKVYGALDSSGPYYNALKFINRLYRGGLIDPDSRQQDYQAAAEKVAAGGCLASPVSFAGSKIYNTSAHTAENKIMLPLIPGEAKPVAYDEDSRGQVEWCIGAKTEHPELCMSIINWLASPDGMLTFLYGPQGLTWDRSENGALFLTEKGEAAMADGLGTVIEEGSFTEGALQIVSGVWNQSSNIPGDALGQNYNYMTWDSFAPDAKCDAEKSWRDVTGEKTASGYLYNNKNKKSVPATNIKFEAPGNDNELYPDWDSLKETIVNGSWDCMYAADDAEFDELFEKMTEKANSFNYKGSVQYMQELADERFAAEQALSEK
jgi:multiple sugar transport system substrate-binding protein/putative aldouronate transport system substrate-binding protein